MASVSFKTADQVVQVAASKDARALINTYRSEEKPTNAVAAQSLQKAWPQPLQQVHVWAA